MNERAKSDLAEEEKRRKRRQAISDKKVARLARENVAQIRKAKDSSDEEEDADGSEEEDGKGEARRSSCVSKVRKSEVK